MPWARSMWRIAPVPWFLTVAACADSPAPVPPLPAASQPDPVPAAGPLHSGQRDFGEMLDALSAGAPSALSAPDLMSPQAPTAPPGGPVRPTDVTAWPHSAPAVSYQENLATCLDGRFPAFCDHDRLSEHDASQVLNAEYEANLITCIDPQWQHLCRPELLPADEPDEPIVPSANAAKSGIMEQAHQAESAHSPL
jgi:hypothetical protein